jgi:nucleoside-diphosphate-sugar epimerase
LKIAVLGANGFVGGRIVEKLHLEKTAEVRPVVRTFAGLARLARFDDLDWRLADARDEKALAKALEGCEVVVNAIQCEPRAIIEAAAKSYRAAEAARVRKLIFLSSAAVNGLAPAPGTDEATPVRDDSPFPYNNAKVRSERELLQLRGKGTVELVILRPSII